MLARVLGIGTAFVFIAAAAPAAYSASTFQSRSWCAPMR
jgi:hypothetical protein